MEKNLSYLVDAYVALLKIDDPLIRLSLNRTYCYLRDKIAEIMHKTPQFVQEKFEEIALYEKREMNVRECNSFNDFLQSKYGTKGFGGAWVNTVQIRWNEYKYFFSKLK